MSTLRPAAWLPEHDYTPTEDRSVIRTLRTTPGVVSMDDFITSPTSPNGWNVTVSPGRAVIDADASPWTGGSYIVYSPSATTLPVTPAHGTLDRYDVVILHVYDAENSPLQGFGWQPEIVQGTPGVATPPTLPFNSLPLRALKITHGSTAVTNASFLDRHSFAGFGAPDMYSDFRNPNGLPLWSQTNNVEQTAPGNWFWRPFMFDMGIPAGWEHLALWPFPIRMEVEFHFHLYQIGSPALIQWWFKFGRMSAPGTNPGTTGPEPRMTDFHQFTVTGAQTNLSMVYERAFPAGEPPLWDARLYHQTANFGASCDAITKIWPLTSTTHMLGLTGRFDGWTPWWGQ